MALKKYIFHLGKRLMKLMAFLMVSIIVHQIFVYAVAYMKKDSYNFPRCYVAVIEDGEVDFIDYSSFNKQHPMIKNEGQSSKVTPKESWFFEFKEQRKIAVTTYVSDDYNRVFYYRVNDNKLVPILCTLENIGTYLNSVLITLLLLFIFKIFRYKLRHKKS